MPYLREVLPYPTLQMHPDAARPRGIKDGDWVIVESPHGNMKIKAQVNPGIRPDTVMALHGWWQGCEELQLPGFPLLEGGANSNSMYSVDDQKGFRSCGHRDVQSDACAGEEGMTVEWRRRMAKQYGFYIDTDRCVQCHACEVACKSWNGIEPGIRWRRVLDVWQGQFPKVTNQTISYSCMHCEKPRVCPNLS